MGVVNWCIVLVETLLKPQHSSPNPNRLANQLWCIDFLAPPTPLIIPHRTHRLPWISYATQKTDAWFMQDSRKAVWSIPYVFSGIFSKFKTEFYCISFLLMCPDVQIAFFGIHQLGQPGYSRVHSNSCCSCSFEAEIIKIGQSSHKMYSNNILHF